MLEDLEAGVLEYETVGKFLVDIREEFGGGDEDTSMCNLDNEDMLREITVKIGLEKIDTQEGVMVEALLDSEVTGLVMSLEFVRKQGFKLKKIKRLIYVRNVDGMLNKEKPIENTVEVNIYYQGHREKMEIDMIGGQK